MQKDVIYIDVEDDITAIIGKVKSAKHKIVALVPPKRVGVLQSAVNLRLVNRAATQKDKRLVIITNNQALSSLAAAATIPVAKTLQSKPELAPIDAVEVDDGDDIIDGADLPVGDHASQAPGSLTDNEPAAVATAGMAVANAKDPSSAKKATPPAAGTAAKPKVKRGPVVPNFNTFRKRLVLITLAIGLLIGLLVWALVFAPQARVSVLTRTTDTAVNQQVNLVSGARTSVSSSVIEATTQTTTDDVSVEFEATGERNVGERATGTVTFSSDSIRTLVGGVTIPAGTELTSSSGATYTTDASVSLSLTNNSGTTGITASDRGENYNGATGSVSGAPRGIDASITSATSGGTDRTVKVATQRDINTARDRAMAAVDREAARNELTNKFGDGFIVIADSLQVDTGSLKSSVDADAEASNGRATYGGKVTYTMYGVAKSELDNYLKAVLEQQIDDTDRQRVYESGADEVNFTNVDRADNGVRATLSTNGKIGPTIEEGEIKELAAGKRIGDIQGAVEAISGVQSVDVELSPFWVTSAPDNTDKITVEFQLDE